MNDVEFRDKWLNLADNAVAKTGDETEEERILRLKKSYQDYQLTIDEHKKNIELYSKEREKFGKKVEEANELLESVNVEISLVESTLKVIDRSLMADRSADEKIELNNSRKTISKRLESLKESRGLALQEVSAMLSGFEQFTSKIKSLKDSVSIIENQMEWLSGEISGVRTSEKRQENLNRTTAKRLPSFDCMMEFTKKGVEAFWDGETLYTEGGYVLYAEISDDEVTEKAIEEGLIVSTANKFFRAVLSTKDDGLQDSPYKNIENIFNKDYYRKVNVDGVVEMVPREHFLVDLYSLFYPLKSENAEATGEKLIEVLKKLVSTCPIVVNFLPLYLFDSLAMVNIIKNNLVYGVAKLKSGAQDGLVEAELTKKYANNVYQAFTNRRDLARVERIKKRNEWRNWHW